ncbi:bifunctional 4-hydroxy-2-oxoglutarate aldolase/2-dehydro-3-deoxy-phosphogluconate aldolase, partial [uncultured Sphingomonas sp.]
MTDIGQIMRTSAVIPVLVIEDAATARPLAEALVAGGLRVLEVTMRTPAAIDAIREMKQVRGAIVGAGTVVSADQFEQVVEAGAEFIVSPGLTEQLARPIIASGVPYLPGVATAGDIMRGLDLGLTHFKFFPAETSGGLKALKALAAPFYQCRFCPTGGVSEANAADWLAFDPVLCVGGSWVATGSPA